MERKREAKKQQKLEKAKAKERERRMKLKIKFDRRAWRTEQLKDNVHVFASPIENGKLISALQWPDVEVEALGTVMILPNFVRRKCIYPVGYTSKAFFSSPYNAEERAEFVNTITAESSNEGNGELRPVFHVQYKSVKARGHSPGAAWANMFSILSRIFERRWKAMECGIAQTCRSLGINELGNNSIPTVEFVKVGGAIYRLSRLRRLFEKPLNQSCLRLHVEEESVAHVKEARSR